MSRTFAHVPFRHAFPEYEAYYARERRPLDRTESILYYAAAPEFPREGNKHFSRPERGDFFWCEDSVNRGRNFTRMMTRQRTRAEIAQQLTDWEADQDECEDWAEFGWDGPLYDEWDEFAPTWWA